jgi:uncharacterized protein YecE (DUF72 family)
MSDSRNWPLCGSVTSNIVYIRMHGPKKLLASNYSRKELINLSDKIKIFLKSKKKVFVYFNNDAKGFAVKNALFLKKTLKS